MLPCVLDPDLAGFDWPAARLPENCDRPRMSDDFLQAALPPSCCRTGRGAGSGVYQAWRWSRFHRPTTPGAAPQVDPLALTGRWGARRSFWDVAPPGATVGTPRQKVGRPSPLMCLVPSAGLGPWYGPPDPVGNRKDRTSRCRHRGKHARYSRCHRSKPQRVKSGIPGCAP